MTDSRAHVVLICIAAGVVMAPVVAGVPGYSVSGSPAIETPTASVTFEGQEYTVDSVSRIDADGSVTVTTTVPSGTSYDLNLRGPDNQLISTERLTGNETYTFEYFGPEQAGSYAVTIQDDGDTVAVHPVVIAGYDATVADPGAVAAGEETTLTATVTERDIDRHSDLDRVQVVIGNADVERRAEMTAGDGDSYEASVDTEGLDPGTYNVYVVVRGDETVRERAEILGVSDTVELTVDGQMTPTPTPTETTTETDTVTGDPTTPSSTTASGGDSTSATESSTLTESEEVLDPSTTTPDTPTGGSGDGFTIGAAVLVILGLASGRILRGR